MNEVWRIIPGLESYEVSSLGRIRYAKTQRIRKLFSYRGYQIINITGQNFFVHRLVALAFIGEPIDETINHKNFNRSDNRPENLEYLSRLDNIKYSRNLGRYPAITNPSGFNGYACRKGVNHSRAKLDDGDVLAIRNSDEQTVILAARYGVTKTHIRNILKRRAWPHLK